jgi:hypothetical protein
MFAIHRRPRKRFSPWPALRAGSGLALAAALLAACGGSSAPPAPAGFEIQTLSSAPDVVSGGDTLLQVRAPEGVPLDKVRVSLNGQDVTDQLPLRDSGARTLRGLLQGLTEAPGSASGSSNLVVASHADRPQQRAELTLVNYPITGPILSGPHIAPYECRTVQNGLGMPLDANCSATTQVAWYYRTTTNTFQPLADPTGPRPLNLANTTTNTGATVPYIVRVESGTINRGVYRLAVLDNPQPGNAGTWKPGAGWNRKVVVQFDGGGGARYNQGEHPIQTVLSDRELSRGFALVNSTELFNAQHANPYVQGETLMMLREHIIETFGEVPRWFAGFGGSGGAIQQYLVAQLFPGLLDGIQAEASFPETLMPEVMECRLLNNFYATAPGTWTTAKQNAVNGFNTNTCIAWDLAFANIIKSDNAAGCAFVEPANVANVFNRATNPNGVRCDVFQTNVNLLGRRPGTQEARRPLDNVGVQYGLDALNKGAISVTEFLDLNERVGGYDGDGIPRAARTLADDGALEATYGAGLKNGFTGPGLAHVPIITMRGNADVLGDIHDPMQDLIIRARLQRANGRSDNQIIWSAGATSGVDYRAGALDLINTWLDRIAADPAPPSIDKVVRNKPAGAGDACWDTTGRRIDEAVSLDPAAQCNVVYPRFSTPRLVAGSPLVNDVLKCQLRPVAMSDYAVPFTGAEEARLRTIFPTGVCDWSKPGVGQQPLRGTYLRLPLR